MLSIATLVALTVMVVTSQRYLIEGKKEAVEAECLDLAAMHCEAVLSEILKKKYDASATFNYTQSTSEFTGATSLGPNSYERSQVTPWPDMKPFRANTAFDDVDDYHNYQRIVNTDLVTAIRITVQVYYVAASDPTTKVYYQTYTKRVVVTAQHSTYLSPISFSTIVTY